MTTAAPPQSALPAKKTPPSLSLDTSKVLLYGPPKIGKSTLAANIDPDHTIFLATEQGLGALEVFQLPINSWSAFLVAGESLVNDKHDFKYVVIDTVDELARMCVDYVLRELNQRSKHPRDGFLHSSDFEYGKGYDAATEEFRLRVAKLCSLGLGVIFISHAKEGTVTGRTGEELTTYQAKIGARGMRDWLTGYVDHILLARAEGDERVLRTRPTPEFEAGSRDEGALPDPLPLDAKALREALEKAGK